MTNSGVTGVPSGQAASGDVALQAGDLPGPGLLAMGTAGPSTTPMPLMSAAEVPSAGHATALRCSWLGVAVLVSGVTVSAADVAGPGGAAVPEVDVFSFPVVQPARQASAASSTRIPLCRR